MGGEQGVVRAGGAQRAQKAATLWLIIRDLPQFSLSRAVTGAQGTC